METRQIDSLSREDLEIVFRNPQGLVHEYFRDEKGDPLMLTSYQVDIVKRIINKKPHRNLLWASTRAGKSYAVAIGCILAGILRWGEKIRVIGPTSSHANIIMGYILGHIGDHPDIIKSITLRSGPTTVERARRELSRNRITFETGSEVSILTAGINTDGRQLLGWGGTIVVVDECEVIPPDIVRTKIMRMVGEEKEAMVLLIGNPVYKGFMYEMTRNDLWNSLRVGWEEAVKEGRISQEFIEERKQSLTDAEFAIWYEARYPEDSDNTLIRWEWIQEATDKEIDLGTHLFDCLGVDPAGMGDDLTVMTYIGRFDNGILVRDIQAWGKTEMIESSRIITQYVKDKNIPYVVVDDTGLGGMAGILRETLPSCAIVPINFTNRAETIERASNMKAEIYINLREFFRKGEICIPNHQVLRSQLNNLLVEGLATGKQRVDDGQTKSPDFSDSLALACWLKVAGEIEMGTVRFLR